MGLETVIIVALLGIWGSSLGDDVRETVVLLPDEDGGIGQVAVNPGGDEVLLDEAGESALIGDETKTAKLSDSQINAIFADAIAARPQAPASYILYFEEGGTRLAPGSESVMNGMFADLDKRAAPDITIIGHTDTVGSLKANDRLALKRAETVMTWLGDQGVDKDLMDAAGRGERELLVKTGDNVDEAKNRRVEISIR